MRLQLLFCLALNAAFVSLAFAQETPNAGAQRGYMISPGDEISGKVLGEPQYDFVSTVNENGMIYVPFSPENKPVNVKCRSELELRNDITNLLAKYLRNPQIGINIKKNYRTATIYGEVNKPMEVELRRKATLVELIAMAGGMKEEAGGMIQVIRTQPPLCTDNFSEKDRWVSASGDPTDAPSRLFSLSNVKLAREESNPVIYPGDVILVQKAAPVYITGEVMAPQGIYLKEGGTSLYEAIAKISGLKPEAKTKEVKIFRLKANSLDRDHRDTIVANLDLIRKGVEKDVMLEPYDIIQVDKSKDSIAMTILKVVAGIGKQAANQVTGGLGYRIAY